MTAGVTVGEAIRAAADALALEWGRLDAETLMAHALGVSRSAMLLTHMRDPAPDAFHALLDRRLAHEPVAYILGHQEFYGLDLVVTRDTLIPRGDSETLIEAARDMFADRPPARVLDLGTGTGALLLAALTLFPGANGAGVDASPAALIVAGANAARLDLDRRARMVQRDWRKAGWADGLGRFDLVLCNPPYIRDAAPLDPSVRDFEPASALFAGADGLDDYRVLIPQMRDLMADGGRAIFEIGASQMDEVGDLARDRGFAVTVRRDLAGRPRAVILA